MTDRRQKGRSKHRHPALILSLVVLGWVAVTAGLGGIAQLEDVCTGCHAMRPYSAARSGMPHESVSCVACHGAGAGVGVLVDGLSMERRVLATLLSRPVAPTPLEADGPCRSCHGKAIADTLSADGVRVRHADFSEVQCTQCHAGSGHRIDSRTYAQARMDDCLTCHRTQALDQSSCEICHYESSVSNDSTSTIWRVMHGTNWKATHGAGDLDTCESCHPRSLCARCHKLPLPHPPAWPRGHGRFVVSAGSASCPTCHDGQWCAECHGVQMPHPAGFAIEHPDAVEDVADPACVRCHDAQSCRGCHESAHRQLPGVGVPHREQVER